MDNKTKKFTGKQISSKDNVILHLSDLHFGYDKNEQKKADREIVLKELIDVLSQQESDWKPTIVCISGDIAWKAKNSDYKAAEEWINKLLHTLDIELNNVIISPGNHDVNQDKVYIAHTKDPKKADNTLRVPVAGFFKDHFREYIKFYKKTGIPPLSFGNSPSYLVGYRIVKGVRFISCNSAWFSQNDEDEGKLWLGLNFLQYLYSKDQLPVTNVIEGGLVTIALFHHPSRCLNENETNRFYNRTATLDYLAERCHLILTGHSHGCLRKADTIHQQAYIVGGGATYSGKDYRNNFKLIKVSENGFFYKSYEWDPQKSSKGWISDGEPEYIMFLECFNENVVSGLEQKVRKKERELLTNEQTALPKVKVGSSSPQQTVVLIKQTKEEIKIYDESIKLKDKTITEEFIAKKGKTFLRRIKNQLAVLDLKNAFSEGQQLERWIANYENKIPSDLAAGLYELLVNIELTKKNTQLPNNKAWDLTRAKFFLEKAKNVIESEE
jgi:calcineurin-like phosphoesterase family protein